MKLFCKTALYRLLVSLPIVLGGAYLLNGYIHRNVIHEIDELLTSELVQVQTYLRQHPIAPGQSPGWDPNIRIEPLASGSPTPVTFDDSIWTDPRENEPLPVRQLRTTYAVGGRYYRLTLQQSYLEFNEIADNLAVGIIVFFLVVVLLLLLTELLVSRRIWQPFYSIIQRLQHYRVDGLAPDFPASNVYEFSLLSQTLDGMSQRTRHQFAQQKQFTDNASHEMQTPLSVVSFELDLLQQSELLTEIDLERIQRAQQEIRRLSALNQSLLLLARIDNHQFADSESIHIGKLIDQLLDAYADYAAHKRIVLTRRIETDPVRSLNRQLADVLFSNLIKNGLRHGDAGGTLLVEVTGDGVTISNEGNPLPFPEENLFRRFVRNQALPQSTGLGLALVREIAGQYGMSVQYAYSPTHRQHRFVVRF